MLLSCSDIVALYDIDNDTKPIAVSTKHKSQSKVNISVFNHNSRVIASGGEDGIINFHNWNLDYISCIEDSDLAGGAVTSLSFNSNSNYLAYGSTLGHLKIWDLKTSNTQLNYKFNSNYITSMSFNGDSTNLTIGTAGGDIVNFNMLTFAPTNFKFQSYFKLNALKYSPLMTNLVGSAFDDGSIRVIDMTNGEIINNFSGYHEGTATGLSFSPINKVFLCTVGLDCSVNFFDISAKKHIKGITTENPITSVCFNNDGQTIACGGVNGNIVLYDLRYFNTPKAVLKGHSTQINYLEFSKRNVNKSSSHSNNVNTVQNTSSNKVQDNLSMSAKSNRSFGSIDTNIPYNMQNNYVNPNLVKTENNANNSNFMKNNNLKTSNFNEVKNNTELTKLKNSSNKNLEINTNLINIDFKDTSFKDVNKDSSMRDIVQTSVEKKKNETFTLSNLNSNNLNNHPNTNTFNKNSNFENKTKMPPLLLNMKHNDNVQMQEIQENLDTNLNLENKVQIFIQNCVETEMFKLRGFIHEEINSLHVDLIRQFEIQHSDLIKSLKSFTVVNNKMTKELDKMKKDNKDLKSQFF